MLEVSRVAAMVHDDTTAEAVKPVFTLQNLFSLAWAYLGESRAFTY